MYSTGTKKQIFEACRQNLLDSIRILEDEMKMLKESASDDSAIGMSDRLESNDEEMMNDRKDREKRRTQLYQELSLLDSLNTGSLVKKVEPGAVVITNQRNLLIAIARMFKSAEYDFTGISAAAPIYAVIEGKKAGDKYSFNGQDFMITEVY